MTKVYSKALDQSIEIDRIIGHIRGQQQGSTLIFMGGIHGNEPAGVFALKEVFDDLAHNHTNIKGTLYAISGNLTALKHGERYRTVDLNRIWTDERVSKLNGQSNPLNPEIDEQREIWAVIKRIIEKEPGPFYFFDLHTTSCESAPFLTVNDTILNRKFTSQYPLPIILGIEEHLEGPLLSYINELGYVAFGIEGGQHDSSQSIENHKAFIYLSLVFCECVSNKEISFDEYFTFLNELTKEIEGFHEIFHHHKIAENDTYKMQPGFLNFTQVKKGFELAVSNNQSIKSPANGRIFMPLYQNQGDDGFFLIRKVPRIFLKWSAFLRKFKLDRLLTLLPGIKRAPDKKNVLLVNKKIARFLATELFHLLGYRSHRIDEIHIEMRTREANAKNKAYNKTKWFKR